MGTNSKRKFTLHALPDLVSFPLGKFPRPSRAASSLQKVNRLLEAERDQVNMNIDIRSRIYLEVIAI